MKISLVIPAYNEENELGACLDAVAAQQIKPYEVIIVDNNSTDNTLEVAKRYPFVTIIHESKQGVDYARDAGFNAATGDIIGRIDADTYLPADWTKQLERIFSDEKIDSVTGSVFYKDMPAPDFSRKFDTLLREAAHKSTKDHPFLFGSNMALRREAWQQVKDEVCHIKSLHEDIDLGIHLAKHGRSVLFDKDMVAGMSMRRVNNSAAEFYKYLKMTIDTYLHHGIAPSYLAYPYGLILMALYPGLHFVKRAYDPKTKNFSIKKFMNNQEISRKNPMA